MAGTWKWVAAGVAAGVVAGTIVGSMRPPARPTSPPEEAPAPLEPEAKPAGHAKPEPTFVDTYVPPREIAEVDPELAHPTSDPEASKVIQSLRQWAKQKSARPSASAGPVAIPLGDARLASITPEGRRAIESEAVRLTDLPGERAMLSVRDSADGLEVLAEDKEGHRARVRLDPAQAAAHPAQAEAYRRGEVFFDPGGSGRGRVIPLDKNANALLGNDLFRMRPPHSPVRERADARLTVAGRELVRRIAEEQGCDFYVLADAPKPSKELLERLDDAELEAQGRTSRHAYPAPKAAPAPPAPEPVAMAAEPAAAATETAEPEGPRTGFSAAIESR